MSRNPIGEKAMTPAERQRRRRARLRAERPPSKPGRPRHSWVETSEAEKFCLLVGAHLKARAERRGAAGRLYQTVAAEVLGIHKGCESYSAENENRYKRLQKKTILEAIGRFGFYVRVHEGLDVESVFAVMRDWADDLIEEKITAEEAVRFFRWLRTDGINDDAR